MGSLPVGFSGNGGVFVSLKLTTSVNNKYEIYDKIMSREKMY